jgi:hypothetical protein
MSTMRAASTNTGVGIEGALVPDLASEAGPGASCFFQKTNAPSVPRESRINQNHQRLKNCRLGGRLFDSTVLVMAFLHKNYPRFVDGMTSALRIIFVSHPVNGMDNFSFR